GSIFELPFKDASFDCVICSEVIEHVPADEKVFSELLRVLEPGGRLILGTPDYDRWRWRALEWVYGKVSPGGYADEHITHYSRHLPDAAERDGRGRRSCRHKTRTLAWAWTRGASRSSHSRSRSCHFLGAASSAAYRSRTPSSRSPLRAPQPDAAAARRFRPRSRCR